MSLDRLRDPIVAEGVLRLLVAGRNRERELRRWASKPWFGPIALELQAIAQGRTPAASSVSETPLGRVSEWVTPKVAAAETGRSEQWITRLARRRAIVARKHGRSWLIDMDSAANVCGRKGPDGHHDGRDDGTGRRSG